MGRLSWIPQVSLKCYHKRPYKREGEGEGAFTPGEKKTTLQRKQRKRFKMLLGSF